jgi:hypothetical protein
MDERYQSLDLIKDKGYFLVFEHSNEVAELLFRSINQRLLADIVCGEGTPLPSLLGFQDFHPTPSLLLYPFIDHLFQSSSDSPQPTDLLTLKHMLL